MGRAPALQWDQLDPLHLVGLSPGATTPPGSTPPASGIQHAAGPGLGDLDAPPWSPDSPIFWVMTFAAVTLGLIAGATTVRVGPFRASAAAGDT